MNRKIFGYARVSSKDQKLDRQIKILSEYVTDQQDIFKDKASGKDTDRPEYQRLKQVIRENDTLIVKELDRLSRNKKDIATELSYFKDKGVNVVILDIPTTKMLLQDDFKGIKWVIEMINNILIEVLSTIAEQERKKIRKRQKEGIAVAREQGKHLGRPKKVNMKDKETQEIIKKVIDKKMTVVSASNQLGISRPCFYNIKKEYLKGVK
ncbi:MAG: recombinase family protein [Bacillota bacterium]|nr:recombinase family protein [Bacillota bacterium]